MSGAEPGTSTEVTSAAPDTTRTSRWSVMALSPRAAVVLAAVVVGIAVVVVVVGAVTGPGGTDGRGGVVSVTGAASAQASGGAGGGAAGGVSSGALGTASGGSSGGALGGASGAASVVVHVIGAVAEPGLVTLAAGSRVSDAVERAGGATGGADLSRVNLARVVVDGERVWVPAAGETTAPPAVDGTSDGPGVPDAGGAGDVGSGSGSGSGSGLGAGPGAGPGAAAGSSDGLVDLNTADRAALETLPGIGPALADRIIAWRDEHGGFRAVEDLLDVSGIGDGRFADLRDRVRV